LRMSYRWTVALALLLGISFVAAHSSLVSADSCTAQLVSPLSPTYYNEFGQIGVPVTATCSFSATQLYAVGNAVDVFGNNFGSANAVLTSTYQGNVFNGQLLFTIPLSIPSDRVQISASIHSNSTDGPSLTSTYQYIQVISLSAHHWYSPSYPVPPYYPQYPHPR